MFYVYRHIRLDKNEPFYIGIGMPKRFDNYRRARKTSDRNAIWKKIVSKTPYRIEIMLESDNINRIVDAEKFFIALYGKIVDGTGTLCNVQNGGHISIKEGEILRKRRRDLDKSVYCVTDKIFFNSIKDAAEHYNIDRSVISLACNGKIPKAVNRLFIFSKDINTFDKSLIGTEQINLRKYHTSGIAVKCLEDEKVFPNMQFAADFYDIGRSDISRALKLNKKVRGLSFQCIGDHKVRNKKIAIRSITDDIEFGSLKECANHYKISESTIYKILSGMSTKKQSNLKLIRL
jgi:hypothetical protein